MYYRLIKERTYFIHIYKYIYIYIYMHICIKNKITKLENKISSNCFKQYKCVPSVPKTFERNLCKEKRVFLYYFSLLF